MTLSRKIIALSVLSATSVSCAATPNTTPIRKDAVLVNAERGEIREAIRIFIREDAGRFVIADPDSLARKPDMTVRRRARDFESQSRTLPPANLNYRLVSNGTQCWLIRHVSDRNSPIAVERLLPETAQCVFYSEK